MTGPAARHVPVALAVMVATAFAVAAHLALIDSLPRGAGALLSLAPLAVIAFTMFRRTRHRLVALMVLALAAAFCALNWSGLEEHFPGLFFVEHAGGNLVLAFFFGRTLAPGREPLVTTFARIAHDGIDDRVARYTRRVTLAWTIFFMAIAASSAALYFGGYGEAWSLLANLGTPLLVGAMFIAEYLVRHRVLPDLERIGILGGMRAFSRHFG